MIRPGDAEHPGRESVAGLTSLLERTGGLNLPSYGPIVGALHHSEVVTPPPGHRQQWLTLTEHRKPVAAALVVWRPGTMSASADLAVEAKLHDELFPRILTCARHFASAHGVTTLRFKAQTPSSTARFLLSNGLRVNDGLRLQFDIRQPPQVSTHRDGLTWAGSSPRLLLDSLARLTGETVTDRLAREAQWAALGYRWFGAAIRHPRCGSVLSTTEVVVGPRDPTVGFVRRTVTSPAARRQGLATWVKNAALGRALAEGERLTRLLTFNDCANHAALALNRSQGFHPVAALSFWEVPCR